MPEQARLDRGQHPPRLGGLPHDPDELVELVDDRVDVTRAKSVEQASYPLGIAGLDGQSLWGGFGLHAPFKRINGGRVDTHHATSSRNAGAAWRSLPITRSRARVTDLAHTPRSDAARSTAATEHTPRIHFGIVGFCRSASTRASSSATSSSSSTPWRSDQLRRISS